jgi:hypothetical protein
MAGQDREGPRKVLLVYCREYELEPALKRQIDKHLERPEEQKEERDERGRWCGCCYESELEEFFN